MNSDCNWKITDVEASVTTQYGYDKIEEGEIICDKCKGAGITEMFVYLDNNDPLKLIWTDKPDLVNKKYLLGNHSMEGQCEKCKGKGKLNWIENVFCK